MGETSTIGWTMATWNWLYGCRMFGPECLNCYAIRDALRMAGNPNVKISRRFVDLAQIEIGKARDGKPARRLKNWTGKVSVDLERLYEPKRWKDPRMVFVNSLSDVGIGWNERDKGKSRVEVLEPLGNDARVWKLWTDQVEPAMRRQATTGRPWEQVPDPILCEWMAVMEDCPQHIFQVLTKRTGFLVWFLLGYAERRLGKQSGFEPSISQAQATDFYREHFPHVWWGTSAGTQPRLEWSAQYLDYCPGAVKFWSWEPLLKPLNLAHAFDQALMRERPKPAGMRYWAPSAADWGIVGGESKDGHRPIDGGLETLDDVVYQCDQWQVPLYVKQTGEDLAHELGLDLLNRPDGKPDKKGEHHLPLTIHVRQYPKQHDEWLERYYNPFHGIEEDEVPDHVLAATSGGCFP